MKVELKVVAGSHEGRKFQLNNHDTFFVGRDLQDCFACVHSSLSF